MGSPAILTAALTGPIATKADNAALPTTPDEIAAEARASWEAEAAVVHVHVRDGQGRPWGALLGDSGGRVTRVSTGVIEAQPA